MNWQNFPDEAKRAVVPKRGTFSEFDYSQIEPRFFAYFTAMPPVRDDTVAAWYHEGRDVYREIAGRVFGREDVTDDERQLGKVWFLMSLYQAGPRKIAEEIGMTLKEAKQFYKDFHEGLPMLKALSNPEPSRPDIRWVKGAIETMYYDSRRREPMPDGTRSGYLRTPHGRHLHAEQWGEYKLLNKLIQGSAADMMKAALLRVYRWLRAHPEIESRMVSVIHDSLIFDGPEHEIPLLHDNVPALMCDEPWFTAVVPLKVDHKVSVTSWAEQITYDEWKDSQ